MIGIHLFMKIILSLSSFHNFIAMADDSSSISSTAPTTTYAPTDTGNMRYVQSGVLFILFSMAIAGNTIVVVKLATHHRRVKTEHLSTVSLLCLNLALADIIASFCCILSNAIMYLMDEFVAGNGVCKVLKFLQRLGLAASTFIVVTISVDRYLVIRYPMRRKHQYEALCMVIIVWLLATLFSIPQMIVFKISNEPVNGVEVLQCAGFDETAEPWQELVYNLALLFILYLIPVGVIITCYSMILRRITVESRTGDHSDQMVIRTKLYKRARNTSLLMSCIVIGTFIFCWAPFYMALIVHLVTKPAPPENYYYNHAIYFCGLGHSALNPLFYGAFHIIRRARRETSTSRARSSSSVPPRNTRRTSALSIQPSPAGLSSM